ncbi:hypothetical protein GDO86_002349 [Hymenochirus boettgeri]|uniref:Metaxin n=1 Tax=Hymenochirus boettgeri TaxID=247094 RepID=A0A8T2KM63_9PIPI|nr:hypothetical protein GDO86_002349 [Hymenochirus boettgeri]
MELRCWGGDWGLPSVHHESLIVLGGNVPALTSAEQEICLPANILNYFRKQKYNADYVLSAKQGSDTLAYIALLEEKLLPAVLHMFWVDSENYSSVTRPWFASRTPFPMCYFLPWKMSRDALNKILVKKGQPPLYSLTEVESQVYKDAKECLNLLSNRLGTAQFFFGNTPTSLDAFVFGFLAPVYKVHLPRAQLQQHLKQLSNLCGFCDHILSTYFMPKDEAAAAGQEAIDANLQKLTQLVNQESSLIEKMDDSLHRSPQNHPQRLSTLKSDKILENRDSSKLLSS